MQYMCIYQVVFHDLLSHTYDHVGTIKIINKASCGDPEFFSWVGQRDTCAFNGGPRHISSNYTM